MNSRRVHELMVLNFPPVELAKLNWINVLEADGTIRSAALDALMREFIRADDILVGINRKIADFKPREHVLPYIREHMCKGQIRMADRDFQGYVLIAMTGVAAGWSS